jgi:aspartate 1-decarboxylase
MQNIYSREMLKSKIYYATITGSDLLYEGSLSMDQEIMEKSGIAPGEMYIRNYGAPEQRNNVP